MGLRQCDKCSEMVDEAKAFCPSCGHAFVEEHTRQAPSVFESMEGTMQLGNTMYNQMLSDMGLNISAAPNKPAESVQPVAQPAVRTCKTPANQPLRDRLSRNRDRILAARIQPHYTEHQFLDARTLRRKSLGVRAFAFPLR